MSLNGPEGQIVISHQENLANMQNQNYIKMGNVSAKSDLNFPSENTINFQK